MSVQPSSEMAAAPNWSGWQGALINGVYPLHRLLNGSERSAVFLTEFKGRADTNAAVKIIPIERVTLAQLTHWKLAIGLSHPHLIQLLDAGLCQLGGQQFLFVVMEYADQTLAQVLQQRALTADEVREMLPATLDALTFLHGKGLVHGHLKPANVLVVNDLLKLSSDSIRPAGAPRVGIVEPSLCDPPDADHAPFSAAGDIWGLGMTLVEALTQRLPSLDVQSVGLPTTVPPAFVDTVQRCLSYNPATRPSAADLAAQFGGAPQVPPAPPAPIPQAVVRESPPVAPTPDSPRPRGLRPGIAAIVSTVFLAVVWAGWLLFRTHPSSQPTAVTGPIAAQQPAVPAIAAQSPTGHLPGPATTVPSGIHVQTPDVPPKALGTIHGHFRIGVLVVVDHSGTVIRALLQNTGPSPYFARRALDAAMKSRFAAADQPGNREWLLRYEFTRRGVTGDAVPRS
jgi:hypothetical protein